MTSLKHQPECLQAKHPGKVGERRLVLRTSLRQRWGRYVQHLRKRTAVEVGIIQARSKNAQGPFVQHVLTTSIPVIICAGHGRKASASVSKNANDKCDATLSLPGSPQTEGSSIMVEACAQCVSDHPAEPPPVARRRHSERRSELASCGLADQQHRVGLQLVREGRAASYKPMSPGAGQTSRPRRWRGWPRRETVAGR